MYSDNLAQSWELDGDLFEQLEQFNCTMYKGKISQSANTVNELRYQFFCAKRGEGESSQLPPCRDCLFLHAQTANYQAAIWKRCLDAHPHRAWVDGRRWQAEHPLNAISTSPSGGIGATGLQVSMVLQAA